MNLNVLLDGVRRRLRLALMLEGMAWGAGVALAAVLVLRVGFGAGLGVGIGLGLGSGSSWAPWALMILGAGLGSAVRLAVALRRDAGLQRAAVAAIEIGVPQSRNVVLTASELLSDSKLLGDSKLVGASERGLGGGAGEVTDRIFREAERVTQGVNPAALVPVRRPLAGAAAAGVGWALALWLLAGAPGSPVSLPLATQEGARRAAASSPLEISISVTVIPPAYLGLPRTVLENPERLDVVQGSRIEVSVQGAPGSAVLRGAALERVEGRQPLEPVGSRPVGSGPVGSGPAGSSEETGADGSTAADATQRFGGQFVAEADGFLAIDAWGESEVRRLIGLTVRPDRLPDVRVTTPGEDLRIADGDRVLSLAIEAEDDFALASLELRYTRVTGFGELFTFEEGQVPLNIRVVDAGRWEATAEWDLRSLVLERGDLVVYRAVARDRRPGALEGESDTWAIELVSPDAVAVGGGGSEEELDRYAMSQQMVVVLTERLMARRDELSDEDFRREVSTLAAAQRRVRAEFVFMLGGALDDGHEHDGNDEEYLRLHEEAHALADADVAEGRLAHQGRQELSRAVQSMSRALAGLDAFDLERALVSERAALLALQRAFSSSRYILRALSERETLDFTRRLTGNPAGAIPDRRPGELGREDPQTQALRGVVAALAPWVGEVASGRGGRNASDRARATSDLALAVLRIDPAAEAFQRSGDALRRAADADNAGKADAADALLEEAFARLVTELRLQVEPAPPAAPTLGMGRLMGALADGDRR